MKILLISLNYAPEITGIGFYSGELAQQLVVKGHEVRVICSYPFYPEWRRDDSYPGRGWTTRTEGGVEVHRCPCYIPKRTSGLRRIIHYFSFAFSALVPALRMAKRHRPAIARARPNCTATSFFGPKSSSNILNNPGLRARSSNWPKIIP